MFSLHAKLLKLSFFDFFDSLAMYLQSWKPFQNLWYQTHFLFPLPAPLNSSKKMSVADLTGVLIPSFIFPPFKLFPYSLIPEIWSPTPGTCPFPSPPDFWYLPPLPLQILMVVFYRILIVVPKIFFRFFVTFTRLKRYPLLKVEQKTFCLSEEMVFNQK